MQNCMAQRGVSHLTIPIDIQEKKLSGKFSRHNVAYHTSDVYVAETIPSHSLIEKAAEILNAGSRIVILVGQGALGAGEEVFAVAEKLSAPVIKALLGKSVIPDDNPYSLGGLGSIGTNHQWCYERSRYALYDWNILSIYRVSSKARSSKRNSN